jgi:predicted  nucleic acid-binding Zn-ribbon protein
MTSQFTETHKEMIAVAAYYRAEHRRFHEGDPLTDWLEAEAEIEQIFQAEPSQLMSEKQTFQEKLVAQLDEWDMKLAELRSRLKGSKVKIRDESEKQLDTIAGMRAAIEEKLRELQKRSEDTWEDLKEVTAKAFDEMKEELDRVVARFK